MNKRGSVSGEVRLQVRLSTEYDPKQAEDVPVWIGSLRWNGMADRRGPTFTAGTIAEVFQQAAALVATTEDLIVRDVDDAALVKAETDAEPRRSHAASNQPRRASSRAKRQAVASKRKRR